MKINVQNYLYHGINDIDVTKCLDGIFSSGYIYTRDSLKKYLNDFEYRRFEECHLANWNGNDAISIACHPSDINFIKKYNLKQNSSEDAHREFILDANISLVLDKTLLESFKIKQKSLRMNYELQILGDIPIKYIVAIAINYSDKIYNLKDLYILKKILLELNNGYIGKYYYKYKNILYLLENYENFSSLLYRKMQHLNNINNLLNKYKLDIPIIDLNYGYIISNKDNEKKIFLEVEKQYLKYKAIKTKRNS